MAQTVLENSTFNDYDIFFDAANPISGKGIQLRSPTPISPSIEKLYPFHISDS